MEFKEYRLNDISNKIGDGIHGTPKYDNSGEYYFLNGNNLINGKIVIKSDTKRINEMEYKKYKKDLSERTLLISINGTLGNIAKYNNEKCILGKSACYVNVDLDNNVDYVKYFLMSDYFQDFLFNSANGTTIKNVPLSAIRNCIIKLPSLENQNKIADILSVIDKKIELNNHISDNLEQMSKELYDQWFVDFEFPDKNKNPYKSFGGKMIDSEVGKIPEGWRVGYISDGILTSIMKSGINFYDYEKKYVATADVDGVSINNYQNISYSNKPSRANMQPIQNSVWFAKMQSSKKNILIDGNCKNIIDDYIFSTGFMGLECKKNSVYYIWNYINTESFSILKDSMSTGTLMAGLSNSVMNNFKYTIPSQRLLDEFNEILSSYYSTIFNNNNMNTNLQSLKNILLSKLMNGEIDLENINI